MSCQQEKSHTPSSMFSEAEEDTSGIYDLPQIQAEGLLVAATLSGPDTYYEMRGKEFGLQFEMAEEFASHIGARLNMEIAPDTAILYEMLQNGIIELIALQLGPDSMWVTREDSPILTEKLQKWWDPKRPGKILNKEKKQHNIRRRIRPKMADPMHGIISQFDDLFVRYSSTAGWDWRLLAAQCYQESGFDPQAVSWAGAQGLMQIMPATARQLGLSANKVFDPEQNIAAGARYIRKLQSTFSDIPDPNERICFILAAYNGGSHHVRDAMSLTRKHGGNDKVWNDVAPYILHLAEPKWYNDPVVKNGYLRGSETEEYVRSIMQRWKDYRGSARASSSGSTPAPAHKSLQNGEYQSQVKSAKDFLEEKDTEIR